MASNSVTPEINRQEVSDAIAAALEPDTRKHPSGQEYFQEAWEGSPLQMSISNRLCRVERSINGIGAIHKLLHEDSIKAAAARDEEDRYVYTPLPINIVEGLHLGILELMTVVHGCLDDIRMDEFGIATKQSKGGR